MKSRVFAYAVLAALALAPLATAQNPNTANATMTVNSIDQGAYPINVQLITPGSMTFDLSGNLSAASTPFIIASANSAAAPGFPIAVGMTVDLDIGSIGLMVDGTRPDLSLLNVFAWLDNGGNATLALPFTPQVAAPTPVGAFQGAILDPVSPIGFYLTAASNVTLIAPPNYGTLHYSNGFDTSNHAGYSQSAPNAPIPNAAMPAVYDIESIYLAGFQEWDRDSSHPAWKKDLSTTPYTALPVSENSSFRNIKTLFGHLYAYQDMTASPNTFGLALHTPSTGLVPIAATTLIGNGATGTSMSFESEIAIHNNIAAYVTDQDAPALDGVNLLALDGPSLSGAQQVVTITPVAGNIPTGIAEESLTILNNHLLFVGSLTSTSPSYGLLYEAPLDGSAPATEILTIPPVVAGAAAPTFIDGEIRQSGDRSMAVFIGGTSSSGTEDLYAFIDAGPGTSTTINLSQFPTAENIQVFGDESDGLDNRVAISSSNSRVAFLTGTSTTNVELRIVDLAVPGVLTHITNDTDFDPTLDNVMELRWVGDDKLLFWCGSSSSLLDLYVYDVPLATTTNLTATGTAAAPFLVSGNVDVDNNFVDLGGNFIYYIMDGQMDAGGTGTNSTANLVALELTTLTLIDVFGSQFSAGTGPDIDNVSAFSHWQYAKNTNTISFHAEDPAGTDDRVHIFDASTAGPGVALTGFVATGQQVESPSISDDGTKVVYGFRANSSSSFNEEIWMVNTAVPGSEVVAFADPGTTSGDLTDGTLVWVNAADFAFAHGTSTTANPNDSRLYLVQTATLSSLLLDGTSGSYWIY